MAEFDTGLPSVRQIQNLIKTQQNVEVKLTTSDVLIGKIRWQDAQCLCLIDSSNQTTLVWRQSITYIQPKS